MRILFSLLLVIVSTTAFSQQKHALLIGISEYPSSSGWTKINADNDIELLKLEISKKGFNTKTIQNKKATKIDIINALNTLIDNSRPNDQILIHISTHGQQVLNKNNTLIEAIIPYDAEMYYRKGKYQGEKHITDEELGVYFDKIRSKIGPAGVLFITIDACHSGDAIRALGEDTPIRGTNAVFTDDPFYTRPNIKQIQKNRVIPHEESKSALIAVYACQSYQNNYEIKVGNDYFGSLSYSFHQVLKNNSNKNDLLGWAKEIILEMNKRTRKQNPYFESTFVF